MATIVLKAPAVEQACNEAIQGVKDRRARNLESAIDSLMSITFFSFLKMKRVLRYKTRTAALEALKEPDFFGSQHAIIMDGGWQLIEQLNKLANLAASSKDGLITINETDGNLIRNYL